MFHGHPRNQKFIQRFEKLRQDALTSNNINLSRGYTQVILSLRKFPLPITSITQAELLQGVGSGYLTEFHSLLDTEIEASSSPRWKTAIMSGIEQFSLEMGGFPLLDDASSDDSGVPKQKQARTTGYTPPIGSSAWACIIIMHAQGGGLPAGVGVPEIYSSLEGLFVKYPKTRKFSDKVITKLAKRGVLEMFTTSSIQYARFTSEGCVIATNLWQKSLRSENLSTLLNLDQYLHPQEAGRDQATFELIMLVDNREFSIVNTLDVMRPDIRIEQRTLPVADVIWVWRKDKSDEYMSGYAVERKTIEDLSTSIKDGRWEEQRRRLSRAPGVSSVLYLVEGDYEEAASRSPGLLPQQSIRTAVTQTELVTGFSVVTTAHVSETTLALLEIHNRIKTSGTCPDSAEDMADCYSTYRDFAGDIHKSNSLTIAQVTSKILRAIPGVGGEAVVGLNDYLVKSGMVGLTLANVAKILHDPNLCDTMKSVTGAKRAPLTGPALAALREQYLSNNNSKQS